MSFKPFPRFFFPTQSNLTLPRFWDFSRTSRTRGSLYSCPLIKHFQNWSACRFKDFQDSRVLAYFVLNSFNSHSVVFFSGDCFFELILFTIKCNCRINFCRRQKLSLTLDSFRVDLRMTKNRYLLIPDHFIKCEA